MQARVRTQGVEMALEMEKEMEREMEREMEILYLDV